MTATILQFPDQHRKARISRQIDRIFVDLGNFGRLASGMPRENNLRPDSTPVVGKAEDIDPDGRGIA